MVMSDLPNGRALAKAYLVKDDRQYAVNQRVCRLTAKKAYFTYLYYLLDRHPDLLRHNDGSNQTHLTNANYLKLCVYLPPLTEQTAIANFLDQKTAEIDQAIALKTDLIERLKEYKQITIQHAVTRGLDPNAKMKASGVEWIGDIPEIWSCQKLKLVSQFVLDGTHGSYPRVYDGYRLLSVRNIINSQFVFRDDDSRVSLRHFKEISSNFLPQKGDIMLAIVGATLGKVAIVESVEEAFVTQRSLATIRTNAKCKNSFVAFFMSSFSFQSYLWNNTGFSAQPGVYLNTLKNSYIPVPPLAEQAAIVAHIEAISAKIDQATDQAQQQINTLTEYKTVLINAAVTGKIKVTDDSAQGTNHAQ